MKNKKIFIACDTKSIKKVKKIIKETQTNKIKIGYKFGLEFFNSKNGRKFVSKLFKNNIREIAERRINIYVNIFLIFEFE